MLYLFTDFGWQGPYLGEMKAVLARTVPDKPTIDLMHDAPQFNPRASAYLLAALSHRFRQGDYCLAVVDPGVGHEARRALLVHADGVTYIGPDNGLFAVIATSGEKCTCSEILWRPPNLSDSFHGRDLFAPALVMDIMAQEYSRREMIRTDMAGYGCPVSLAEVIYIDAFGNCITGLRAVDIDTATNLTVNGALLEYARTFAMVEVGTLFWYVNSMGLVEIACNQGSAAARIGLSVGSHVQFAQAG